MNIAEIKNIFTKTYGEGDVRIFTAPGRVNLIGEHIDYCGGPVMPTALTMKTILLARRREDDIIRLCATDLDVMVETHISNIPACKGKLSWGNYQLGVILELMNAGYDICGCDLLYHDTVPHGAGLSSSAAIELSTALCFATFSNEKNNRNKEVDRIELALLSQKAEHNFIGVKCGIMDQFASAMGRADHAIFLNCATLGYEYIPLAQNDCSIVLTNTHVKHSLGNSKYNERRAECEEGLCAFQKVLPNIKQLAEVTVEQFERYQSIIPTDTIRKLTRHIIYECDRVYKSAEALKENNLILFGKYMIESHQSLQYNYEVSCPELDYIVNLGSHIDGVLGSRMTGAGFGGCTVAIIKNDSIKNYMQVVEKAYQENFGRSVSFYVTETGDGCKEIK